MGDTHVGLQARLMSQALRKLAGNLSRANTICLFTNQIREKIGVQFGCFHMTLAWCLPMAARRKSARSSISACRSRSCRWIRSTGEIAPKRIVDYFNNGETDEWLQFEVAAGGGSGRRKFACTPNHLVFTPGGETLAGEIEEGDEVLAAVKHYALREDQEKLIVGSALGDGSLRFASDHNVAFRVGHGLEQREYCEWKHEMLAPFAHKVGPTGNGIGFDTIPMRQLAWLHAAVHSEAGSRIVTDELLQSLDERAVAAWYCDDGSFSGSYERWGHGKAVIYNRSLSPADKERLAARLEELGMGRPTVRDRELLFSGERTRMLHERIAPYVHPSMDYKLHPDFRERFQWHPDTSDAHLNGTRLCVANEFAGCPHEGHAQVPQATDSEEARSFRPSD